MGGGARQRVVRWRRVALVAGLLAWAGLLAGLGLAVAASAAPAAPAAPGSPWVVLAQPWASGLHQPTDLAFTGLVSDTRLFVGERAGVIRMVRADGTLLPAPFLDISAKVNSKNYPEAGLLALAFDPHYAVNGRFYVYYTAEDQSGSGDVLHLSRFQVSADPDVAAITETSVLTLAHPGHYNHTGAQLEFGVDGDLYIGLGDGGLVDEHDDPGFNAQDRRTLLGKMLRLSVSDVPTYSVPASNPFTQTAGARPEIWSLGLRNPWRFSFDRQTHDLYIADVGQSAWEEVDFAPHDSAGGENYGWNCYEGSHVYTPAACTLAGTVMPVAEYPHTEANASIIGGYVYRGSAYPALQGAYLFADYIDGEFWRMDSVTHAVTPLGHLMDHPVSFGESPAGELYVTSIAEGTIARIVALDTPNHAYMPVVVKP